MLDPCLRRLPLICAIISLAAGLAACDDGEADPPDRGADVGPDGAPPDPLPDATTPDGSALDGSAPDSGPDGLDARPGDMRADATPIDMAPDAAPRDPVPTRRLPLDEAEIEGPHARLEGGGLLLDPGATLRWRIDADAQAEAPTLTLALAATIWRVEDGAFRLRWTAGVEEIDAQAELRGDADAAPRRARMPYADWTAPAFGADAQPPAVELPVGPGPWTLEVQAVGGGAVLHHAWLVDPLGALPEPAPRPEPPAGTALAPMPCAEPDCDDGALITAAIAEAPAGPVHVTLAAATYTLRSTLRVGRDDVYIRGAGPDGFESATTLLWDPPAGGQVPAVRFAGSGLRNGAAAPIRGPVDAGSRVMRVEAPADWAPERVWLTADDFGEVPPICVDGRDVERFSRHIGRHLRVVSIAPDPDAPDLLRVELDRAPYLALPAESNPRLVPADLIRGGGLSEVHLQANCPEALQIDNFAQAPCTNPTVIDDNGLFIEWAEGVRASFVSARGFGKFAIVVQRALDIRVEDCAMDHPSAYGGGGQGYGVHLIRTGRTVVRRSRVEVARHGVVVDFGSTDAQVLDGWFRTMNQAHIDVHGEASYDTLVRGNDLAGSTLGVIVGGGGRDVHCNDGPRHHVEHNRITDIAGSGITISDYTPEVFVRGNTVDDSGVLVTAAFGASDILIEHNDFGDVTLGFSPVSLANVDTGGVVVRRNLFRSHCSPEAAARAIIGAEDPVVSENVYCPGDPSP